jgi:SpoVK/Ycf46/Vps4 family AAA+-type ATPase
MAPVVLFIDEIDQTDLSKRGGDSGNPVASNLFNEILTFLGDRWLTGRVVVIAATNRADLLDDALIRPGRLNPVIPILLPNKEDRIEIYRAQGRYQGVRIDEEAIAYAASASVDYSAADIESVVSKACDLAEEEGMEGIDEATIKLALSYIQAQSPQTAKLYTDIALIKCTDRQFLPKTVAISDQATMRGEIVEAASELGITTGFSRGSRRESF